MIAAAELPTIVAAAINRDERAWERLVNEFTPMIKAIARRHRLASCDQDEVAQRTWVAVVRRIGDVRDAASVGGWIATTARRECLGIIRDSARQVPSDDLVVDATSDADHDEPMILEQRRETVWLVASTLPARKRELLTALSEEPALSLKQVSERLGMPIGSIGPTRQRCLERMRKDPRIAQMLDGGAPFNRPTRAVRAELELN